MEDIPSEIELFNKITGLDLKVTLKEDNGIQKQSALKSDRRSLSYNQQTNRVICRGRVLLKNDRKVMNIIAANIHKFE